MQNEIVKPSKLLNERGELVQKGWSRKPVLTYNPENVHGRLKEWDYYCIIDHEKLHGVAFTFADLRIMGLFNVVWLDFKEKRFITDEETKIRSKGLGMPSSSKEGDCFYAGKRVQMKFQRFAGKRHLSVKFPSFDDGRGFEADLTLEQPDDLESIVVATPWPKKTTAFYYNEKINCMPASGTVTVGGKDYTFSPASAFGVLDWGRGVWTYRNRWYWGSASGKTPEGKRLGWNIGYGFGDLTTHTENMIFYDGKGHKFDQVTFHIDTADYLKPWKFTSNDGRFEMDFEPILDRNSKVNLVVFKSIQHQVFGYYTGDVILDDGTKLHVDKLLGFAEDVYNRW